MTMPAAQVSSLTTGHGCWPPTLIAQGAPTVIGVSLPQARVGDIAIPHTCIYPIPSPMYTHGLLVAMGSSSVIIESMPAARVGDFMTCGDIIAVGAPTIIIGG